MFGKSFRFARACVRSLVWIYDCLFSDIFYVLAMVSYMVLIVFVYVSYMFVYYVFLISSYRFMFSDMFMQFHAFSCMFPTRSFTTFSYIALIMFPTISYSCPTISVHFAILFVYSTISYERHMRRLLSPPTLFFESHKHVFDTKTLSFKSGGVSEFAVENYKI